MGYHRDTFDQVRRGLQVGCVGAFVEEKRGPQRVSNELRLVGAEVSPSGGRGVWLRHDIETRYKRLTRLEQHAQGDTIVLSDKSDPPARTPLGRVTLPTCGRHPRGSTLEYYYEFAVYDTFVA